MIHRRLEACTTALGGLEQLYEEDMDKRDQMLSDKAACSPMTVCDDTRVVSLAESSVSQIIPVQAASTMVLPGTITQVGRLMHFIYRGDH